jgi:hypothetical protein
MSKETKSILFVCVQNASRSQIDNSAPHLTPLPQGKVEVKGFLRKLEGGVPWRKDVR